MRGSAAGILMVVWSGQAAARPGLLDDVRQERRAPAEPTRGHLGWLLAQAPSTTIVTTTDGRVFSGTVQEDLVAGIILRLPSGEAVFIERATIRNIARSVGPGTEAPPALAAPPAPRSAVPAPLPAESPSALPAPTEQFSVPVPAAETSGGIRLEAPGWGEREVKTMTRLEINDELRIIVRARPAIGLAIAGISVGSLLTLGGAAVIIFGGASGGGLLAICIVGAAVGITLLILGIVALSRIRPVRAKMNARITALEDQIERLDDLERERRAHGPSRDFEGAVFARF